MGNTKWTIDPSHSEVIFKVKHLMISTVTGSFDIFEGHAETESEEFKIAKNLSFKADVKSVNTKNEQRDTHLKSADFFNMEQHPYIEFTAQNVDLSSGKVEGNLSIRDVSKPVVLNLDFGGTVVDGYGQTKTGITVSGKINRKEFGLSWNNVTEAGNIVVSDDVRLSAEIQFTKQA